MQVGLQIPDFTWPSGPNRLGPELASFTRAADDAGFAYISVMDHFWQIPMIGPPEHEMFEAYTTLGFIAANTSRATLHTLVTGVVYRPPGLLAKAVTTLDVLSGGRAMLGIGAAWNEAEACGLGFEFPPLAERFERLEETIQICRQMWSDDDGPYRGKHFQLERTLNSPQALSKPHPPIMIGGSGERKTLRLVARYAQACNLYPGPEIARKLEVLREHCENERRDYGDIVKTCILPLDVGANGEKTGELIDRIGGLADAGIQAVIGSVPVPSRMRSVEIIGSDVIPAVAGL